MTPISHPPLGQATPGSPGPTGPFAGADRARPGPGRLHGPLRWGVALLACLASQAQAQPAAATAQAVPTRTPQPLQLAQAELGRRIFIGDGAVFSGSGGADGGRVVLGAPYCADAEHETVQWLADGSGGAPNRITRTTRTRLCRDGEGRTRQAFERNGRQVVYLRDPQARESWVLDPERKTARRLGDGRHDATDTAAWREYGERMRAWARGLAERVRPAGGADNVTPPTPPTPPAPPMPPAPPPPPTPVLIHAQPGAPESERRVEVEIIRLPRDGAGPAVDGPLPPPAVQWRSQVLGPRGAGTVTPLPAREIEGLRANGERTTWVIEAGKVGNEKPIQITREVWTSPDLMVTLQSRDFDPRSGEVNYRLKNVARGEPDAALMRVPADYRKPARPAAQASGAGG